MAAGGAGWPDCAGGEPRCLVSAVFWGSRAASGSDGCSYGPSSFPSLTLAAVVEVQGWAGSRLNLSRLCAWLAWLVRRAAWLVSAIMRPAGAGGDRALYSALVRLYFLCCIQCWAHATRQTLRCCCVPRGQWSREGSRAQSVMGSS